MNQELIDEIIKELKSLEFEATVHDSGISGRWVRGRKMFVGSGWSTVVLAALELERVFEKYFSIQIDKMQWNSRYKLEISFFESMYHV